MIKYNPMGRRWLLVAIVILASILRLYQLGKTPISLEWDEVAIGYDAYSILKTGRDQFGSFVPLTFRSLDDYKPPIYEYLTVPAVAFFDLTEFSVRLPSALAGIAAVVLTYFLVHVICSQTYGLKKHSSFISLVAAFLLAISPWHLQFSRAAFEVNVSVMITIAAVCYFLVGLSRPKYFLLSAALFGLDLFSYHSTRVVTPLLMTSLFLMFNKQLVKSTRTAWFLFMYGFFFLFFIPILLSPEAQIRFTATNIFNPGTPYLDDVNLPKIYFDERQKDTAAGFTLAGKMFHNQRLIYSDYETLKKVFEQYISHFGFEFLFVKGDAPLHHAPGFGLLYIWELPFLLVGFLYILSKGRNRYTMILLMWLLIVPIPSAVTRGAPHAVRTELFLPVFQIVTAIGVAVCYFTVRRESRVVLIPAIIASCLFLMSNHSVYLHQYYVHTNYELSRYWMHGRKEAIAFTEKQKHNYDRVIISPRIEMPHMFWLFYTKYSPQTYLSEGGTVSGGFAEDRNRFDKYEFHLFDYNNLPRDEKILLVGRADGVPSDFPGGANILKTIHYLDGSQGLIIAENKH